MENSFSDRNDRSSKFLGNQRQALDSDYQFERAHFGFAKQKWSRICHENFASTRQFNPNFARFVLSSEQWSRKGYLGVVGGRKLRTSSQIVVYSSFASLYGSKFGGFRFAKSSWANRVELGRKSVLGWPKWDVQKFGKSGFDFCHIWEKVGKDWQIWGPGWFGAPIFETDYSIQKWRHAWRSIPNRLNFASNSEYDRKVLKQRGSHSLVHSWLTQNYWG